MDNNKHIQQLAEDALSSIDDIQRAQPKPYLLTRINARMDKGPSSAWEQAGRFITRPIVAFALCSLILANFVWVLVSQPSQPRTEQVQNGQDDFSYTVATIYDTENTEQ